MHFRQQPHLEWEARSVGRHSDEMIVFGDDALAGVHFLTDDVAENAALLFVVVVLGTVYFLAHAVWNDRERDELGMGMIYSCAGGLVVIFED